MNRLVFHFLLFAALVNGLSAQAPENPGLSEASARFNRFALGMFSTLRTDRPGNVVSSPWSAYRTLLHECAGGESRREIGAAAGGDPVADSTLIRTAIKTSVDQFNLRGEMHMAANRERVAFIHWQDLCAGWMAHTLKVRPEFSKALTRLPETHIRAVDFAGNSSKLVVDVNTWVSNATHGRIPQIVERTAFTKDTQMVMTSALHFRAAWKKRFDVKDTKPQPFTLTGGKAQPVPTMKQKDRVASLVHDEFTVIGLRSLGHGFQLLLFVPKAVDGLAAIEAKLTPELIQSCAAMKETEIELHLPRFRVPVVARSLRAPFAAQGIRTVFDRTGKADFSGLSDQPLSIDEASEACEFLVDESGMSGSAANLVVSSTFGEIGTLPKDSVFRVDRPFLFAFQHIDSGACLFMGRIVDPR